MSRLYRRLDLNILFAITITGMFGYPLVNPVLPTMRDAFAVDDAVIGWVMTAYALPAFVCYPLVGYLGDRYGKMRVIVPSAFVFAVAGLGTLWVDSFAQLVALRALQGVGAAAISVLNMALVGDMLSGNERRTAMGYLAAVQNGGSGVLPVIGGALALLGWHVPFLLYILAVPAALMGLWKIEAASSASRSAGKGYMGDALHALRDRRVVELLTLSCGFIFVGFGAFVTYIPIFLSNRFGVNTAVIGLIIAARTVSGVVVAAQFGSLTARFPMRGLIAFAFAVMAVTMATVPLMPGAWWVLLTGLGYGVAFAIIRPGIQSAILDAAPEDMRSTFSAAHGLSLRVAHSTAPVLAGLLLLVGDIDDIYVVAAAMCVLLMVLTLMTKRAFTPADD